MGVRVDAYLPPDVGAHEVSEVLGQLVGMPRVRLASDIKLSADSPGYGHIVIKSRGEHLLADGGKHAVCYYLYNARSPRYRVCFNVSAHSSPFWCAVMKRLVQWFGGCVRYSDCDDGKRNLFYSRRKCIVGRGGLLPEDGRNQEKYMVALHDLLPVSPSEVKAMRNRAGYRDLGVVEAS